MSSKNGSGPKLERKLNLSPPRANPKVESLNQSAIVPPTSPPSLCISSENQENNNNQKHCNNPEVTSMVLVGCPPCLMYVMLSKDDPKCPKHQSTVLLDFFYDDNNFNPRRG